MTKVAKMIGWDVAPSSTYARHSFATNLSRQKIPMDYIGFAMGYSVGNRGQITKRYISPYSIEERQALQTFIQKFSKISNACFTALQMLVRCVDFDHSLSSERSFPIALQHWEYCFYPTRI